ncbi:hypothetical protein RYX36_009502 [Vicia faba]
MKEPKNTTEFTRPQAKVTGQTSDVPLNVNHLKMIFLIKMKTIETLNTCDNTPSDNNFDKLFSEDTIPTKLLNETIAEVDPNVICKNVVCDIKNNMSEVVIEEGDSSEEEIEASQDDGKDKVVSNNKDEIPQTQTNFPEDNVDENVSKNGTEDAEERDEGEEEDNQVAYEVEGRKEDTDKFVNKNTNVNDNFIDDVGDVVHIVVEAETSKMTHKRSKRSAEKKKFVLNPKKSTTSKKSAISSKKIRSSNKKTKGLKKKKSTKRGNKTTIKKNDNLEKKSVVLKRKKFPEKEVEEVLPTYHMPGEIMVPTAKRIKI